MGAKKSLKMILYMIPQDYLTQPLGCLKNEGLAHCASPSAI
jgi:hypothetical protein